jgi:hypothetical protein
VVVGAPSGRVGTEVETLMRSAARFEVASIVAHGRVEEFREERDVSLGRALALVAACVPGFVCHP